MPEKGLHRLWSLAPLKAVAVPPGTHPIDAFIRQSLQTHSLTPSPTADRRALIRRLSYTLTGLPPSFAEVQAFESDPRPDAYDRWVDRYLDSPRYGEHWARHWLDVANYADTHGNDHDYARPHAWPYRDYVIQSFNIDKPFARFLQEQIAGDALFPSDPSATVALGFLAAGPWDHTLMVTVREDTVDHRLAQTLDRDNMVSTVFHTFQSLTIHCARCHDHKFDPISQQEYYSLQAVFAGVDRADRPFDRDPAVHQQRTQLLREKHRLDLPITQLQSVLESKESLRKVEHFEAEWRAQQNEWEPLVGMQVLSTGGTTLDRQSDGSWFASGVRPDRDTYVVTARASSNLLSAIRLEVLTDARLPQQGPGRWDNGNFHLTEFQAFATPPGSDHSGEPIVFRSAIADFDEGPAISAAQAIDGKSETHWGIHPRYGEPHEIIFEVQSPKSYPDGTSFTFMLENQAGAPGHGIGRFRLSTRSSPVHPANLQPLASEWRRLLETPSDQRSTTQRWTLTRFILQKELQDALQALPAPDWVYAATQDFAQDGPNFKPSLEPRPIHVLARGDINKPGMRVSPATLNCLPELSGHFDLPELHDESARRAALAVWLSSKDNVLTWRSIVNRVWSYHFGRGLCETPNDFGVMGSKPSHPELLDWLAIWFRDEAKGSVKALHRLILSSETWKQTSLSQLGSNTDGDNRWLWRQNRQRLSAEAVRDSLLKLSGHLDLTMGGPPAIQFIEHGDATFNSGGNPAFLDYEHFDPDASASKRRAVYRFVFRTVPDPFLDALDCPDGGAATPVRNTSSTALQALALLNDPFLLRQSQHIAESCGGAGSSVATPDSASLTEALFRHILLRRPTDQERVRFAAYLSQHGAANACQWLLNSNEFLFLD